MKRKEKKGNSSVKVKKSKKSGLPPGSLIHIGTQKADNVRIKLINYNSESFEENFVDKITDCKNVDDKSNCIWLNIDGVHNADTLKEAGEVFDLDSLVLEDIMNTQHRPKAEDNETYLFVTLRMLNYNEENSSIENEQVSFILKENVLLSFQEKPGDVFESIRERIRQHKGKVREKEADYLMYLLIDVVVDNYFAIIETIGGQIDDLEEEVLENTSSEVLTEIQTLKKQLILLRKAVYPLREAISYVGKEENEYITKENEKYFRDVHDHIIAVMDSIETYRDVLGTVKDIYLSSLSNKMNVIMKVLTIMSSIFIPLTFIAGIYGMNFKYIPELESEYGYFVVWIVMIVLTLIMLRIFKKKQWL